MSKTKKMPVQHRIMVIDRTPIVRSEEEGGDGKKRFQVTFSTETPYERGGWWAPPYIEILGHKKSEVRLGRLQDSGPVLLEHYRGDHVGVIEDVEIQEGNKKGVAAIRFSSSELGQQVQRDVEDGIKTKMSVGYVVHKMERTKKGDEEEGTLDEYRAVDWEPLEISVVAMPADMNATIGRNAEGAAETRSFPVEIDDGDAVTEETHSMDEKEKGTAPAVTQVVDYSAERKRASDIAQICAARGISAEQTSKFIEGGATIEAVKAVILDMQESTGKGQPAREKSLDTPADVRRAYSYRRAMLAAIGGGKYCKLDGAEREMDAEIRKHVPINYSPRGGVFVPLTLLDERGFERVFNRAMASNAGGKGAELIQDMPADFIEQLYPQTAVLRLGATVLTGLSGPVPFAKQTGGMTFYWPGENPGAGVTGSDLTLGLSLLSPKTIMGKGTVSRQLLLMSNPSVEALIRREMAGGHGRAIDKAAIHGKGTTGEPMGIYKTPGVSATTSWGAPASSYGKYVDMQATVSDKNVPAVSRGFLTTPLLTGKLRQTVKVSSAGSEMIWEGAQGEGLIAGERAISSGQVSKLMTGTDDTGGTNHGIVYGEWNDVIFGSFAGLEIIADELTLADQAMVRFISFGMEDVMLRYPEAFVVADGATL